MLNYQRVTNKHSHSIWFLYMGYMENKVEHPMPKIITWIKQETIINGDGVLLGLPQDTKIQGLYTSCICHSQSSSHIECGKYGLWNRHTHTHTHFLKIIHMIWIIYDLNMKHMNRISESCVNFNHKDFAWLYSFMFIWQRVELVVDALRLVMGSSCPMIFNGLLWLLTPTPTYGVFFPMSNWYEAFLIFLAWVKHGCNGSKIRLALTGKYVTLLEESHPMYLRSSQTVYTDQWIGSSSQFLLEKNIKNTLW